MSFTSKTVAIAIALSTALPAFAEGIMVHDAYARAARPGAPTGAAFMQIMNHSSEDDRLLSVASEVAKRVELHTHKDLGEGVMKMMEIEEGLAIPAGGKHGLARGGDHVMFMGLNQDFVQGESVEITLTFEKAGDVVVQVPIDLERQDHGGMEHGDKAHKHKDH
ncbi:copper chaperone PCu(A)C [Planktotalea sp.]|uniref:copper chaperone PCu(A)C n=1 Tax=Planktotalea sp. TaxID=2029877 RepID=UPI003299593B